MGLLDDAIREHLDLKRRRGADPAEIERAEQEALGPVRREPIGTEEGSGVLADAPEPDLEAPAGGDVPLEPAAGVEPAAGEAYGDEHHLDGEEEGDEYEEEDYDVGEDFEPSTSVLGHGVPADPPVVPPPAGVEPLEPAEPVDPLPPDPDEHLEDTTAYDLPEEARPPRKPGEDEDVLEETPEFLQDTPDHDRLWFEQRPPKDFDFDE